MSFFRALFDFSFTEYVTTRIIKLLYGISIVLGALIWLGFMIAMFSSGSGVWGVLAGLIFAPIGFVVQLIFTRVGYEILIVIFGIAEHTRDMAWALTGGRKAPPATPPAPAQPQYPAYPPQSSNPQYPQYPQQPPQQPPAASQYPQYPQYPQPPQPGK